MNCPLNVEPNLYSKSSVKMNTTEYVKSNKKNEATDYNQYY